MHLEILSEKQKKLLPLLNLFEHDFILVGGTAIALIIDHRNSIDFDLFSIKKFNNSNILRKIQQNWVVEKIIIDEMDQLTVIVEGVKITFLYYPFKIQSEINLDNIISIPSLKSLSAMKAYALARRSKWKDYVDLYFILKRIKLNDIIYSAKEIFKNLFNEKLFRQQLSYFDDIDKSEEIKFVNNNQVDENIIKKELIKASLS